MTDAQGALMIMNEWTGMGGTWASSRMMGGRHDGQPVGMMGSS